jgi:murein DD-endopeptidase MepM/ murein hydrolase activator NlpD
MGLPARIAAALLALALGASAGQSGVAAALTTTIRGQSRPGDLVVLTIAVPSGTASVRVRAFDKDIPSFEVDAHTWRALVGIDLLVAPGRHPIDIEASVGPTVERSTVEVVVTPRRFPTRTLTVDEAFVNPPPAALEQIARDTERLDRIWASSAPAKLWSGPFVRPVPQAANSAFGTRSILNGQPRSPHGGADFLSPAGTPIAAPNAGRVALAGPQYYTGNTVIVDHGLGLFSLFAHLSEIDVHEGDAVRTGEVIGKVGATGRVTGPHLHWTVRANLARVDPLSLLAVLGAP